jgi:septum formation topological specificity factor MinE
MNLLETVIASKKDESDDVKNNRLTIILAILTVASATCDTLTVLTLDKFNPISGIVLALALVVLLFAAWNWKK